MKNQKLMVNQKKLQESVAKHLEPYFLESVLKPMGLDWKYHRVKWLHTFEKQAVFTANRVTEILELTIV